MFILRRAALFLIVLALGAATATADPESRVRALHPRLASLLSMGPERSATFQDLVDRLQASDVIVHVESAPPGHVVDGGMQFVTATAFTRYLRVFVRTDLPGDELLALMAHELRHAVEVAESVEVRDERSFQRYYHQRGRPTHRGRTVTYDTRAAVAAGHRVAVELRTTHTGPASTLAK